MEEFIPYEKLSKKEKRKIDQAQRQTWGELNPVTRKPENSRAYNRNKARNWKREHPVPGIFHLKFQEKICYNIPRGCIAERCSIGIRDSRIVLISSLEFSPQSLPSIGEREV